MAYEFEPYKPESTESIYQRQLGRLMPDIRRQRGEQMGFLQRQMQRMGQVNPQQTALQAVEPYARTIGQAGAAAAGTAETIGRQERETAEKINIQREQMKLKQEQWEQQLAEMVKARQQQGQLQVYPQTGFTREMLESLGMEAFGQRGGLTDWRQMQRNIGQYNLPGQPFGGGGPGFLTAQQKTRLQSMYPGSTRSFRGQQAERFGWIQSGQGYR